MSKDSIGKKFIEETKYQYLQQSDQQQGLPQPPLERAYTGVEKPMDLPRIEELQVAALDLTQAIKNRKSERVYQAEPISLEELAYLLWATQGVKEVFENRATIRTAPSAGARHAFETYLLINNVQGLQPGLYRYLALSHQLVAVDLRADVAKEITQACLGQKFVGTSAVTFIWTAVVYRMTYRYVERGYRYLYLDAGHVCENLYLAAQTVGCGCCAVGAYDDARMNELMGVDGEEEFVIYIAPVGKVAE